MPLWQRLVITLVVIVAVSFAVGLLWSSTLGIAMPSYVSGVIGGIAAVPAWEFLKRVGPARR